MSWGPAAATSLRRGMSSLKAQEESGLGSCSAPHLPLRGKLHGAARALNPLNCTKQQHPERRKQKGNTRPHPKAQPLEGFKHPPPRTAPLVVAVAHSVPPWSQLGSSSSAWEAPSCSQLWPQQVMRELGCQGRSPGWEVGTRDALVGGQRSPAPTRHPGEPDHRGKGSNSPFPAFHRLHPDGRGARLRGLPGVAQVGDDSCPLPHSQVSRVPMWDTYPLDMVCGLF